MDLSNWAERPIQDPAAPPGRDRNACVSPRDGLALATNSLGLYRAPQDTRVVVAMSGGSTFPSSQ